MAHQRGVHPARTGGEMDHAGGGVAAQLSGQILPQDEQRLDE